MRRLCSIQVEGKRYQDSWAYKRVKENYEITVSAIDGDTTAVKIYFDDGSVYASFTIKKEYEETLHDCVFYVYDDDSIINEAFDYDDTLDDCIIGCCEYFLARY